jgi:ABC-type glycerol-3-phosphate transport system substrate-binding protein
MKKTILSLAFAGSMILAASACNSTKNVSGSSDSTTTDSTTVTTTTTTDTAARDTSKTTLPDTTKTPKM